MREDVLLLCVFGKKVSHLENVMGLCMMGVLVDLVFYCRRVFREFRVDWVFRKELGFCQGFESQGFTREYQDFKTH